MIDGLLFVLILINFAITLTLFLRYNKSNEEERVEEIRSEMTDMLVRFNKDAERNIRIMEDRIQKSKDQFNRQEIMLKAMEKTIEKRNHDEELDNSQLNHKKLSANKVEKQLEKKENYENKTKPIEFRDFGLDRKESEQKELMNFKKFIEKYSKTADNPLIIKSNEDQNQVEKNSIPEENKKTTETNLTQLNPAKKSFIQRAYQSAPPKNIEPKQENKTEEIKTTLGTDIDTPKITDEEQSRKEKIRKIARLIGEGKSFEEISEIMNMSMTEIDLFRSLIKNKIIS